jgi:MoCo/4Fe-4S cofactor protein with predicted Tat translocation signal
MPPLNEPTSFWQSLGELADSSEFRQHLAKEFKDLDVENPSSVSRRRFMQLMGASVALAGLQGCRWEKENILPQAERDEMTIPGFPRRFATSMELGGVSRPLLVTSNDGRPTKVEGNPLHRASLGSSDVFAQASILEMCDPERAKQPTMKGEDKSWDELFAALKPKLGALKAKGGEGLAIVGGSTSSAVMKSLRDEVARAFPKATWLDWEPAGLDNVFAGTELAFGSAQRPHYDLRAADVILGLDADFLGVFPDSLRLTRDWATRRNPDGKGNEKMSRFYAVESMFTSTGATADHRLALPSSQIESFALGLEERLEGRAPKAAVDAKCDRFLKALADDLKSRGGRAVVIAGPQQPASVHALAARLNAKLGAQGKTVRYSAESNWKRSDAAGLKDLVARMDAGAVDTLFVMGTNPAYSAPADIDFAGAMEKVGTSVALGLHRDETGRLATWQAPTSHALECWGESRAWDGSWLLQQPLVRPLHDTKSPMEILATLLGRKDTDGFALVKGAVVAAVGGTDAENRWAKSLHDGFVSDTAWKTGSDLTVQDFSAGTPVKVGAVDKGDIGNTLEISFNVDSSVYDGRFANNGWLQEVPDFMTKLTWDNALLLAPSTAEALGVTNEDVVKVTLRGRSLECPVLLMPGQALGTANLALGYGRSEAGVVGGNDVVDSVGVNANLLRSSDALWFDAGAKIEKTGATYELATTQEHHAIGDFQYETAGGVRDRLKQLYRENDLATYEKEPGFANSADVIHHPPLESLWKETDYQAGHKWGMAIDLNKCVGCSACIVGCQSENNIPVVGKADVLKGREMHWLRIDRYFKGDKDEPQAVAQPIPCMQCENAPCEQVCPVAATVHSSEGLNDMVYNRCVGTRYCANNCPYKVRRFNFFNYHKYLNEGKNETLALAHNPDVSVRERGVMEKCTYCVQRIKMGKQLAKNDERTLRDGDIVTACQQACPADAISFGDLNLEGSQVAKDHASPRAYAMLGELNIKPRTLFLAKVTNPNPVLVAQSAEKKG